MPGATRAESPIYSEPRDADQVTLLATDRRPEAKPPKLLAIEPED
jgi:hypothetical protein